jgi:hypothetical protein
MNCLECQELLQSRLDGNLVPASSDFEQHLAGCQSCRQSHTAAVVLLDGLRRLPALEPPLDLSGRLVAAVLRDRQHRQQRTRARVRITFALAASILLMALAGYFLLPERRGDNFGPPGPEIARNVPFPEVEEPGQPLAKSVAEARDAVMSLKDRLTEETKDQARMIIAAAPQSMPSLPEAKELNELTSPEPLDPATQPLLQAGQGVSQGLQTVAGSARRAVGFFFKELPLADGRQPKGNAFTP